MADELFLHAGSWFSCWVPRRRGFSKHRKWPRIPKCPGVYAIFVDGALVYIGSSANLRDRLRAHFGGGMFDKDAVAMWVKFSPMGSGWIDRERRLIKRLAPPRNRIWHPAYKGSPAASRPRRG